MNGQWPDPRLAPGGLFLLGFLKSDAHQLPNQAPPNHPSTLRTAVSIVPVGWPRDYMHNVFQYGSCPVSSWSESSASWSRPHDRAPENTLNPAAPTFISTRPLPHPPFLSIFFVEMGSFSENSDEKPGHLSVDSYQVDTGAQLVTGVDSVLDRAEALRIRYVSVGVMRCVI